MNAEPCNKPLHKDVVARMFNYAYNIKVSWEGEREGAGGGGIFVVP